MTLKQALAVAGAIFCTALAACSTVPEPGPNNSSAAELISPGITLKAADGSFTLYPGEPFQASGFSKTDNNNLGSGSECGEFSYQAIVGRYRQALKCGGIPVRVYASGRSDVIYGILLLNQLDPSIQALGISYRIEVPRPAIRTAARGEMTVLYATVASESVSQYAWLLWLSNRALN
jgi:hypothetical protein